MSNQIARELLRVTHERDEARREVERLREQLAMGGVRVVTDSPGAAMAQLEALCNEAREVANRNKEIADANKRLREKADARAATLRAALEAAVWVALKRPHDGSQLDEDLEGLLLSSRAALSKAQP